MLTESSRVKLLVEREIRFQFLQTLRRLLIFKVTIKYKACSTNMQQEAKLPLHRPSNQIKKLCFRFCTVLLYYTRITLGRH
jgi:hypothetical protein